MNGDIVDLLGQEEYENELTEILTKKDKHVEPLTKMRRWLDKVRMHECTTTPPPPSTHRSMIRESRTKLPELEIKKFNGDILNWQGFWDQFKSSIHDKSEINEIDKSMIGEDANETISGLTISAGNYQQAVE